METFTYFTLLPRDIQLIIWELYEASPSGIRHHLTIGHRQIAYAAVNPARRNRTMRNAAGEDDPAEVRLDPFCKHKFDKIKLATPAFSAPPGAGSASSWSRLGDKWPATDRPSYVYADLERDVFLVDMTRDETQLDPGVSCLDLYPAVCWMPEDLSKVRNMAVPADGDRLHEAFRQLGELPDLRTVRVALRMKQDDHARRTSRDRHAEGDGDAVLRRMRDLPRDAFGFVGLDPFCEAFGDNTADNKVIWDLFGMGIGDIRSASWCNRYTVKDGVEKIPVVDGRFGVEW